MCQTASHHQPVCSTLLLTSKTASTTHNSQKYICRWGPSSGSSSFVPIIDDKKYGPCGSYSRLENHTHSSKWCLLWHKAILASEIKQTWIPTPESMSLVPIIDQWSIPLLTIRRARSMYKAWEKHIHITRKTNHWQMLLKTPDKTSSENYWNSAFNNDLNKTLILDTNLQRANQQRTKKENKVEINRKIKLS